MKVKEVYRLLGEDYDVAIGRMIKDERMEKYFLLFLRDSSFAELEEAIGRDDIESAFKAAHTLKGISANLCFMSLREMADIMTEDLREGANVEHAKAYFPEFKEAYENVIRVIKECQ